MGSPETAVSAARRISCAVLSGSTAVAVPAPRPPLVGDGGSAVACWVAGASPGSAETDGPASTPRFGIDYASTALGLDFALFGNLTTGATDRFGVSAINPQFFGVRGPAALTDPTAAVADEPWSAITPIDHSRWRTSRDTRQGLWIHA